MKLLILWGMKIPYKALKNGHEKPLAQVTLRNPKTGLSNRTLALVDSGSDACFFDSEIGEALGIDTSSGAESKLMGIAPGKWVKQFIHSVTLEYSGHAFSVKVGFVSGLSKHGFGILGQSGFFDQVEAITFEKKKGVFEIII